MNKPEKRKIILIDVALWVVAMILLPLVQILPTGSGSPPKIFSLLIPIFFIMLAGASTYLLGAVIGKPKAAGTALSKLAVS